MVACCPGTDPLPLSPLDPGFHTMLHNSPNQSFVLQEPAIVKKIEQLLEKKNMEKGALDGKDNETDPTLWLVTTIQDYAGIP